MVPVSPNVLFAASSPFAVPMRFHSAVAESLSLFWIIVVAYDFSAAVSVRPASCAWSSRAARMSTLTMLAVSKAASPYAALSPEVTSRTATDTFWSPAGVTDFIAFASNVSWSTVGCVTGSTVASPLPDAEADGAAADDTGPE